MTRRRMTFRGYALAIAVGIITSVLLSLIMVPAFKLGLSPFPKPLALAFAQRILGPVPLAVGLFFHVVYVTFWSVVYLVVFERLTFLNALWLAFLLWVLVLVVFFPIVGWGFLGLAVSPELIAASLVPHLLFALFLWPLGRWAFRPRRAS